MKAFKILAIIALYPLGSSAQELPKAPRYINPMDIPLDLSGNFMEPRNNHFHSGLDMRTQGREGIPVKAVANGWVSRIKISPWGYGKAVYIDHGDGHTSVYAHLQQLKGVAYDACLAAQYRAKDYSIDIYPEKGAVPVVQGDVIGLSGNTGGSGGPHLHFEIRRNSDQHAVDPELFGFLASDRTPPEIVGLRIHPLTDSSQVGPYPAKALGFAAQGGSGRYGLKPGELPSAYGTVGLSLHTYDKYDNSGFRFGVRSIELFVDSVPVFSTRFTEVDFDQNRYCNAHMEFALVKQSNMDYHRCYKLPNNKLRIYGKEAAQGRIALEPGRDHKVRFVVTDGRGNISQLDFILHGATSDEAARWTRAPMAGSLFRYDAPNVMAEEGVRLNLPAGALYDDVHVTYARRSASPSTYSPWHVLHNPMTPIHSHCELEIDVPELPERIGSKLLIVSLDKAGKPSAVGGKWSAGKMSAQVRAFGTYAVMADSTKPSITNVDLRSDMRGRGGFSIRINDDLSGIGSYTGLINGQWILLEYEPKTNTISHTFDKNTTAPGAKQFKLEVKDERGNKNEWNFDLTR